MDDKNRLLYAVYLLCAACLLVPAGMTDVAGAALPKTGGITVPMRPCHTTARAGFSYIEMGKRGQITVDGETFSLYLPTAESYTLKNTTQNTVLDPDNSTAIGVDFSHDGQLRPDEVWHASKPIRIGDRMFTVKEIASNGSSLRLAPSDMTLRGLVVGRRCPDYLFKTQTGKAITTQDLRGKAFIIDIWSVT